MPNADLHTHSYYSSDSDISPTNLVKEAKKIGLKYLALTDHDSLRGIAEALRAGKKLGVEVIPGVEIHSKFGEVLGYLIDHKNPKLVGLCARNKKAANERALKTIKKLAKDGYVLNPQEMKKKYKAEILERPMLAMEMAERGYATSFRDAFSRFLGNGQKYSLKANFLNTETVIKTITAAGGVAVLAHPYYEDYQSEFKNIKKLIASGLAGLECPDWRGKVNRENFKDPKEYDAIVSIIDQIKKIAKKYHLILTSGSDFHGSIHPCNLLGMMNCDEAVVNELKEFIKKRNDHRKKKNR